VPIVCNDGDGPWQLLGLMMSRDLRTKGRFTHETEAREHFTSRTLISGEDEVGPRSLPTTLEGPIEHVKCTMDVKSTWISTWHPMDYVSWSLKLFSLTTSWR
jgi:hypothetical protein